MPCRPMQTADRCLKALFLHGLRISHHDGAITPPRRGLFTTQISHSRFTSLVTPTSLSKVTTLPDWDLETFCERAFLPKIPALLSQDASRQILPASQSWFEAADTDSPSCSLNYDYLSRYGDAIVPLELTQTDPNTGTETFERFHAPLELFLTWMRRHHHDHHQETPPTPPSDPPPPRLYLAQCPLTSLPPALQATLPTPLLVSHAGKGDIYDANLWLGRPPTYTPLHRDPNPNFFLQLAGTKIVRLFAPDVGREIFRAVQDKLGRSGGSAVFRGEEMMQGAEREMLEREIWGEEGRVVEAEGLEAVVGEGNALFIPLGWWHSIRSIGDGVTASVNWWFR